MILFQRLAVLGWLISVCLTSGCSSDDKANATSKTPVAMPLAVGNQWTYWKKNVTPCGSVLDSTQVTTSVVSRQMISNKLWYAVENLGHDTILMRKESDGIWIHPDYGDPCLYLPYPANVGDSSAFSFDGGISYYSIKLAGLDIPVQIGHAEYLCLLYHEFRKDEEYSYCFTPDIGLVLQLRMARGAPPVVTTAWELIDYDLH
jgi:hypothetical protein